MSRDLLRLTFCFLHFCILLLHSANADSNKAEKLCGPKLTEALHFICGRGFSRMTRKSIEPVDYYADLEDDDVPNPYGLDQMPFLSRMGLNQLAKTRRKRLGVYDECCRKPCTSSELKSYCLRK